MGQKLPNIILIVMDTAGAKHMSLNGYARRTTPEMERIADTATVYPRCFASGSWTLPSHATLFTGLYPSQHGVDDSPDDTNLILKPNLQQLGSVLKQAGYRTMAVSCNGLVSPLYGLCRDFDAFFDYSGVSYLPVKVWGNREGHIQELVEQLRQRRDVFGRMSLVLKHLLHNRDLGVFLPMAQSFLAKIFRYGSLYNSAPYTTKTFQTALQHILNHRKCYPETPFLMFINVVENHHHYNPPQQFRRFSRKSDHTNIFPYLMFTEDYAQLREKKTEIWQNLYDDTILFLDAVIGKFWQQLSEAGVLDDTVFSITSDHGEHIGEKGFFVHGLTLYNELISVPLLVQYPAGIAAPGRDYRLASLNDLFGTVLDLIDSPFPRPEHSISLLSSTPRSSVASMNLDIATSRKILLRKLKKYKVRESLKMHRYALILENDLKLIEREDGTVSMYHLKSDPNEEFNRFPTLEPQIREDLLSLLAADQRATGFDAWASKAANCVGA